MSEGPEQDQKTEEPTQHRLDKAFEKGQVAVSKEVSHWLILGAIALTLMVVAPYTLTTFAQYFTAYITMAGEFSLGNASDAELVLKQSLFAALKLILPLTAFIIIFALAAGLAQTRFAIQKNALIPKFERISPKSGLKRIFAKKNLVEFLKGLLKLGFISAGLYVFFSSRLRYLDEWLVIDSLNFFHISSGMIIQAILLAFCVLTVISILDYLFQKFELLKSLRMTKEEVKKEYKETEGDPQIKQKIKQLGQQRIRQNMMVAIPQATAIITNPTHFAVAIKYDQETMSAPIVLAKGADFIALKIREIGKANNIPIFENPPLARALYSSVEIEQEIPSEHYRAVAEIIRLVMKLKKAAF